MQLLERAASAGKKPDPAALIAHIPYCAHLGISAALEGDSVVLTMPFSPHLIGNPMIPALHGGVIGSLLETAALAQVIFETSAVKLPKPVDITVDYLRTGRAVASYASATIRKQGRRVVNVHAEMWQEDRAKPVAGLRGHFLLR